MQLDGCLSSSQKQRSVNEILAETVREIKHRAALQGGQNIPAAKPTSSPAPPPQAPFGLIDAAKVQAYKVESLVSGCHAQAFDNQIIKQGLFAYKDAGIALVTDQLEIISCNPTFAGILLGKELDRDKVPRYAQDAVNLTGAMLRRYIQNTGDERFLLLALQHLSRAVYSESFRECRLSARIVFLIHTSHHQTFFFFYYSWFHLSQRAGKCVYVTKVIVYLSAEYVFLLK
jgi:hypothetical protein